VYYDYFGLKQPPFKITPDTNLFFPGGERGAILEALVYAVTSGEGIIKVVGEVGSGKTMLCRMLQKELPDSVEIVYLANPSLSPENTLQNIAFELKLPIKEHDSKLQVMQHLQDYLLEKHSRNQQVVVFVEEAQGMPIETLEEIRLLSNLETNQNKLLQIILFGQPELDEMIGRKEIRQLKERITYSFNLNPFKINDIKDYVNTRLRSCGFRAGQIFDDGAIKQIGKFSNGLVRRINILADKSMLAAYANNTSQISAKHVRQAARDSEFVTRSLPKWVPAAVLIVIFVVGALVFWQFQLRSEPETIAVNPAPASERVNLVTDSVVVVDERAISEPVDEPEGQNDGVEELLSGADAVDETPLNSMSNAESLKISETLSLVTLDNANSFTADSPDEANPEQKLLEESSNANTESIEVVDTIQTQLIGLNDVFQLQDQGDSRLTDQELTILQRQLEFLPPEAALLPDAFTTATECKLCWSIIYRPVIDNGNL
jgi:type II secretory pathway predicted ATPase ExeA